MIGLWKTGMGGGVGLCLLAAILTCPAVRQAASNPAALSASRPLPPPPHTPSQAALHEAFHHWLEAMQTSDRERYALEAWDPVAAQGIDAEAWRLQIMRHDGSDELNRAVGAARRAVWLSRTHEETYRAVLWLATMEHDAGQHTAELRHARRLIALAPRRRASLVRLRRAAHCTGRTALARQADTALAALPDTPRTRPFAPVRRVLEGSDPPSPRLSPEPGRDPDAARRSRL